MWRHAFYVSVPEAFGLRLYVTSLTMPLQPLRFSLSTQLKPPNTQIIGIAGQSESGIREPGTLVSDKKFTTETRKRLGLENIFVGPE